MRRTPFSPKTTLRIGQVLHSNRICLVLILGIGVSQAQAQALDPARHIEELSDQCKAHVESGRYALAEKICDQAVEESTLFYGEGHLKTAEPLNKLSAAKTALGNLQQAKFLAQKSLKIKRLVPYPDALSIATSLNNIALIHMQTGELDKAETYLREALDKRQSILGVWHKEVAVILTNLGELLRLQGAYAQAEPLLLRSSKIIERTSGTKNIQFARIQHNIGLLYRDEGKFADAAPFYHRAIAIIEDIFGSNNPELAMMINNLAAIYDEIGSPDQVEPLFKRALDIRRATLGSAHPATAESCNNLGSLYLYLGRYAQAEPLLLESLAVREKQLGRMHPLVASTLDSMAELDIALSHFDEAAALKARSLLIFETLVKAASSEPRLRARLERDRDNLDLFYSLLLLPSAKLNALGIEASLLYKGRIAETGAYAHKAILSSLQGSLQRDRYEQWSGFRKEYEKMVLQGPKKQDKAIYENRVKELQNQIDDLEHSLTTNSVVFRNQQIPAPGEMSKAIAKSLPSDGVLIDIVYSTIYDFKFIGSLRNHWKSAHYIAILLSSNGSTKIQDLGEAAAIDELTAEALNALRDIKSDPVPPMKALYQKVFAPLEPKLHGASRIFLAPDGDLNLIPFDALHDGKGYLIDRYSINYLTSGRDLLREPIEARTSPPLVIANPQFSLKPRLTSHAAITLRDGNTRNLYQLAEGFGDLPGTVQEAEFLKQWLPPEARILLGAQATEQAVREAQSPILEIVATHGIFLAESKSAGDAAASTTGSRSNITVVSFSPSTHAPPVPSVQSSTSERMTGAALLLAGAESAAHSPDTEHDGILTAEEARELNLFGTQLVVLSACDTGRGRVHLGQGVLGLRRAFLVAGAETLVTSLWRVADQGTSELMKYFYERVIKGEERLSALRAAMLDMKSAHAHPFYWAPFIGIGRNASLSLPTRTVPASAKNNPPRP